MSGRNRAKEDGIGKTGLLLTNNKPVHEAREGHEGNRRSWKADIASGGSFATDHPNGLCDADENESS
jgi:hypothetical protein